MSTDQGSAAVAAHWARGDVYALIMSALDEMGVDRAAVKVETLSPIDHFHARGLNATVELAERLPIRSEDHLLDVGCGLGGPARYLAQRFGCRVTGIDLTRAFVEAGNRLTELVGMPERVTLEVGDAQRLPYRAATFDGALSLHVTMNLEDRGVFFAGVERVLKPGAFFALTEHGLGPAGAPHYPVPWSDDGTASHLVEPERTTELLRAAGFEAIDLEETGAKYATSYDAAIERFEKGTLPPLGTHRLLGDNALAKLRNASRNIRERRTRPIQVICRKPG